MSDRLAKAVEELAAAFREFRVNEEAHSESHFSVVSSPGHSRGGPPGYSSGPTRTHAPKAASDRRERKASNVTPPGSPTSTVRPATASSVAYHRDVRHYVILVNPDSDIIGYVVGEGAPAWRWIEKTLKGQRLAGSGARLRRVQSEAQAEEIWRQTFPNTPMPRRRI